MYYLSSHRIFSLIIQSFEQYLIFHLKKFKNNILVTTPTLLWLTEPHLYFGFFTEAFTFTLSPTLMGCRLGLEGGNPRSSMWMNLTQYVLPLCCQSTYKMMLYDSHYLTSLVEQETEEPALVVPNLGLRPALYKRPTWVRSSLSLFHLKTAADAAYKML
jgi:hypothetical protein